MRHHRIILITLILLSVASISAFRATGGDWMKELIARLQGYQSQYGQETAYLQTDKSIYKPGEYVWYSAFLVDASSMKPSAISDVLYVELHDPKGNVAEKHKLQVSGGLATGSFYLNPGAVGGLYTLVAYTRWMTNAGDSSYFSKEVQVQKVITPRLLLKLDFEKKAYGAGDTVTANLNVADLRNDAARETAVAVKINIDGSAYHDFTVHTGRDGKAALRFALPAAMQTNDVLLQAIVTYRGTQESVSRAVPVVLNHIALGFYPEGGNWVAGAPSRMAFEAMNEFGKGADIEGEVVDSRGNRVATFSSFHFGMGAFAMTPAAGERYRVRILRPTGIQQTYDLPVAVAGKYLLQVAEQTGKAVRWTVHAPHDGQATIVAQVHGTWQKAIQLNLRAGSNSFDFDTQSLPAGIAVFTLFDADGRAQCERLVFTNKDKRMNISITTDKDIYQPREEVRATVRATDHEGKPVAAKLALGVVDEQLLTMADDKQDNILTWLLLSSELKGTIHEPSFYFDPKEPKAGESFDYLMLTHGWRRFTWDDVRAAGSKPAIKAELMQMVSGRVVDRQGHPCISEVTLVELKGQKRVGTITTKANGRFVFRNIDHTGGVMVLAPYPNEVIVDDKAAVEIAPRTYLTGSEVVETLDLAAPETEVAVNTGKQEADIADVPEFPGTLFGDERTLDEVVVVGYGVETRKELTGAVVTIRQDGLFRGADIQTALSGKVAGVLVQAPNIDAGAEPSIMIRGISSFSGSGGQPLIVMDGVPLEGDMSGINAADIQSVQVLKSPSATAIYGSRGANGVLIITTTQNKNFPRRFKVTYEKPAYNSVMVMPASDGYHQSREYYQAVPLGYQYNRTRSDFRTTVYWQGVVTTDGKGEASVNFRNNDASSAFRITAEGLSGDGLPGRTEKTYASQCPVTVDAKLPAYLGLKDRLQLPVTVRNNTGKARTCLVTLQPTSKLLVKGKVSQTADIAANSAATLWFDIVPEGTAGSSAIYIDMASGEYRERVSYPIELVSITFPYNASFSSSEKESSTLVHIGAYEAGSIKGTVIVHPGILDDLFSGTSAIIRQPYGCFEQASSACFPNIFAMQFMDASRQGSDELRKKAMDYIVEGYQRLAAYESEGGGFEWFGGSPAHEVLTAYGLIEFHEMAKIYKGVNKKMTDRALRFLISRRLADGSFEQHRGKYGFSGAPREVNNAYIAFALAEIGYEEAELSYTYSLAEAERSGDMYRLALMANASGRLGRTKAYQRLTEHFLQSFEGKTTLQSLSDWKVEASIVRSSTKELETLALWTTALLRGEAADQSVISRCIGLINSGRNSYGFGSTQATSLCLQALSLYAQNIAAERKVDPSKLMVAVNGSDCCLLSFTENTTGAVINRQFAEYLKQGDNKLGFRYYESSTVLPYTVTVEWNATTPASSDKCPLRLQVRSATPRVRVNETMRMSIVLTNKSDKGQPMSMAVVGIPAGLSLQSWQLKELQEKGVFDFYEIIDNKLAIYYRELGPKEVKTIHLDLKADITGWYKAAAASAYLYYSQEERHWIDGVEAEVVK